HPPLTRALVPYTTLFRSRCGRRDHRSADRSRVPAWIALLPPPPVRAHFLYVSRCAPLQQPQRQPCVGVALRDVSRSAPDNLVGRSEEHTSELQSPDHLVC